MSDAPAVRQGETRRVSLASIEVGDGFNPRNEFEANQLKQLQRSIKERGLLQPIIVRPLGTGFQLVDGERRFRAILDLGWTEADVQIREVEGDADALVDAVTANQVRVGLNPVEEAQAYARLKASGKNARQIAMELAITERLVKDRLALLELPEACLTFVAEGAVPLGSIATVAKAAALSPKLAEQICKTAAEFDRTATQIVDAPLWRTDTETRDQGYLVGFLGGSLPEWFLPTAELQEVGAEITTLRKYGEYRPSLSEALLSEGHKVGVVWDPGCVLESDEPDYRRNRVPIAICDLAWLDEILVRMAKKALAKERRDARENAKARAAMTGSAPPGHVQDGDNLREMTEEEKAAAKQAKTAEARAERDRAFAANHTVGADIFAKTKPRDLDRDLALQLARMVLGSEVGALGRQGMAFCLPTYAIEPEKPHLPRKYNGEQAAHDVWPFIEGGETPEEVISRLAQVMAYAAVADHKAVAESNRPQRAGRSNGLYAEFARWYCADGLPRKLAITKPPKLDNPVAKPKPPEKEEAKDKADAAPQA